MEEIMYDNLRSMLKNRGGNDYKKYKPEHNGKQKKEAKRCWSGSGFDCAHGRLHRYHECVRLFREYRRAYSLK